MILTIIQQAVGLPVTYDADTKKPWTSGIAKTPTLSTCQLGLTNLQGDGQADLRHHGGPDKAVLAYPAAHYDGWRSTIDLPLGGFGENWTVTGACEHDVCLGDIFEIGSARVQISQPRQPCWKLSRRWNMPDLARIAQQKGWLGWYFRVLSVGSVKAGDAMRLVQRPLPEWPVAKLIAVMHHEPKNIAAATVLAECQHLSESWRNAFAERVKRGPPPDQSARLEGEP